MMCCLCKKHYHHPLTISTTSLSTAYVKPAVTISISISFSITYNPEYVILTSDASIKFIQSFTIFVRLNFLTK